MSSTSEFLSYLNGGAYPSILNSVCGKEESSFVSEVFGCRCYALPR